MKETVKTELDKIVNTLVGTGIVTKVILFGSYARGEETSDSDIDLCVLTPLDEERCFDIMVELRVKLFEIREKKFSLDLLAYNQDFFLACAEKPGFQRNILKNGVVLYE
jgi:predicted nucleotidyltransferase